MFSLVCEDSLQLFYPFLIGFLDFLGGYTCGTRICSCGCVHIRAHEGSLSGVFLDHSPPPFLRQGQSLAEPGAHCLAILAAQRALGIILSLHPGVGVTATNNHAQFSHGCWESEKVLHTYVVSPLSTELSS